MQGFAFRIVSEMASGARAYRTPHNLHDASESSRDAFSYSAGLAISTHQEIILMCGIVKGLSNDSPPGIGSSQLRLPSFGSSQAPQQSC